MELAKKVKGGLPGGQRNMEVKRLTSNAGNLSGGFEIKVKRWLSLRWRSAP